jgi:hypothetical protein
LHSSTPSFSLSGGVLGTSVDTSQITLGLKSYSAFVSFEDLLPQTTNTTTTKLGNPFYSTYNQKSLIPSTLTLSRPAKTGSTTNSLKADTIYYLYNNKFYRIALANSLVTQTTIEPTITIVNNPRVEFESDNNSVVYAHAPKISLTLPVGCEFSGTLEAT